MFYFFPFVLWGTYSKFLLFDCIFPPIHPFFYKLLSISKIRVDIFQLLVYNIVLIFNTKLQVLRLHGFLFWKFPAFRPWSWVLLQTVEFIPLYLRWFFRFPCWLCTVFSSFLPNHLAFPFLFQLNEKIPFVLWSVEYFTLSVLVISLSLLLSKSYSSDSPLPNVKFSPKLSFHFPLTLLFPFDFLLWLLRKTTSLFRTIHWSNLFVYADFSGK